MSQGQTSDIIYLHGLAVDCVVGVWEWERRIEQRVLIDLDMAWDIARAARSDQLEDTLSYKDVAKQVTALVREGKFNLVETMAEQVAALIIEEFGSPWCRVRINKRRAVSSAEDVGVVIERGTRES